MKSVEHPDHDCDATASVTFYAHLGVRSLLVFAVMFPCSRRLSGRSRLARQLIQAANTT
jgi:hypothetical protein